MEPLIDGINFMDHVYDRFAGMDNGDYFYFTSFIATSSELLSRNGRSSNSFLEEIQNLIRKGVDVKVMLSYVPYMRFNMLPKIYHDARGNFGFTKGINNLGCTNGVAIMDNRLPSGLYSSHHQKAIAMRSQGVDWAYVGGMDIAVDRWDNNAHDNPPERTQERYDSWHDIQCCMRGPAVGQIWENFAERWNDRKQPHRKWFVPGGNATGILEYSNKPLKGSYFGTHHVQLLRTLAPGGIYPFAPQGEQSILLAYKKAIDLAEHYIYIEEQHLWPCAIIDNLASAAARGVKIIFLLAHQTGAFIDRWTNSLRFAALEKIKSHSPENVYVYHLQQPDFGPDIYVHSKLMIIDDRYVAIGSANINARSLTVDSELQLAILDDDTEESMINGRSTTVCRFAKQLRMTLWTEHLGITDLNLISDPIDPGTGLPAEWPDPESSSPGSPSQKHHAVCHAVPKPRWRWPGYIKNRILNPKI